MLFLVVAHFAPMPGKQIDNLMNDKDVLKADNTIILQVSATPYNLVTKNTRYPKISEKLQVPRVADDCKSMKLPVLLK